MPVIAIIPARGGSKGIPRKNLQTINGKTLLRIAIEKCQQVVDRVIVSTDDDEIATHAMLSNAEVHRRPDELATDEAVTVDVMADCIKAKQIPMDAEVLLVQCTAPLMTVDDIENVLWQLPGDDEEEESRCDLAVAVHVFHGVLIHKSGESFSRDPNSKRQDWKEYVIAGSVWAAKAGHFGGKLYHGRILPCIVPGPYLDIDTPAELDLARRLLAEPIRSEPCQQPHLWLAAAEALGGGAYVTDAVGPPPSDTTSDEAPHTSEATPQSGDEHDSGSWLNILSAGSVATEDE